MRGLNFILALIDVADALTLEFLWLSSIPHHYSFPPFFPLTHLIFEFHNLQQDTMKEISVVEFLIANAAVVFKVPSPSYKNSIPYTHTLCIYHPLVNHFSYTHTHTHTHSHIHTHTHAYNHTHTQSHIHTHTHAYNHTYTLTHTHTITASRVDL